MRKTIEISYEEYNDIFELSGDDSELLSVAKLQIKSAYAPYSGFKVGSAVQMNNGEIYTGSNQENIAFSPTICGERVALFSAAHLSKSSIKTVAIICSSVEYLVDATNAPCGVCRQVIKEYEMKYNQKIRIILQGTVGKIWIFDGVDNLLPFSFDGLNKTNL